MTGKFLLGVFLLVAWAGAQEKRSLMDNISFIGPRAGLAWIPSDLKDKNESLKAPVHSLFGWQMEVRYTSRKEKFTGYAETGLLFGAVEQGLIQPEAWGYIGIRGLKGFGIGIGPNLSLYGLGLGVAPYYTIVTSELNIPVILGMAMTNSQARFQLITGFSLKD